MKTPKPFILAAFVFLLTACGQNYQVPVNLTEVERTKLEQQAEKLQTQVKEYQSKSKGIPLEVIDLALVYEQMGDLSKAIKTYEDVLVDGQQTVVALNNLAVLYEKTEQYKKAIDIYKKIVKDYKDKNYYYNLFWAYIRDENPDEAQAYYNLWKINSTTTDPSAEEAIQKLKKAK